MRRPVLAVAGSSAVLLTLALPVLGMQTGTGALEQFPRGHEVVRGFEAAAAVTGAGAASPVQVIATAPDRARAAAAGERVRAALAADPGVRAVAEPVASRDGRAVLVVATGRADPESDCRQGRRRAPAHRAARRGGSGRRGRRRRCGRIAARPRPPGLGLDVEDPPVPARALVSRPARAAALRGAAGQGRAGQPAQRRRRVRRAQPGLRPRGDADAAAGAGDRVRPLDGLRGVPAVAHQGALRGDRRHAPGRRRGPGGQRAHDHARRP